MPDFPIDKSPDDHPPPGARGIAAHPGDAPARRFADGTGQLLAPVGPCDGPQPTHDEPWESPVDNLLYADQSRNPAAKLLESHFTR